MNAAIELVFKTISLAFTPVGCGVLLGIMLLLVYIAHRSDQKRHAPKELDRTRKVGEPVYWRDDKGERFHGTLVQWENDYLAIIRTKRGIKAVQC